MPHTKLQLKKGEEKRIRKNHPWIYSNEIDVKATPLQSFTPGQEVTVVAHNQSILGSAYINPHSLIAARLFSRKGDDCLNCEFFTSKILKAVEMRDQVFAKPFYRLVFGEGDELPGLIIDRYANDFVCQINTLGMEKKTDMIVATLLKIFPQTTSILLRNDSPIRNQEGLELYIKPIFGTPPDEIILFENDSQFYVPFLTGQKTGWFYDHRQNRLQLRKYTQNRSVLDVFSYLGAFGIQIAARAKQVDCIEGSQFAADFICKNAQLNQVEKKVNVIVEDAFLAMKHLIQKQKKYDVIVLDPPAFVKRVKDLKEGVLAYQRINELATKLLSPNGVLVSCSCSMHVGMKDLLQIIQRVAVRTQSRFSILERGHQASDHPLHLAIPETDYLKAIFLKKLG